jgi:hypothetical protein
VPVDGRDRSLPTASSVLRRALLVWGAGHLALGDRRGLILLALQVLGYGAWLLAAAQLISGTSWPLLFPLLLGLIAVQLAQAIDAHRRALAVGRTPGGELQLAWSLALTAVLVAGFWLVAGTRGSPEATLAAYASAWRADRVDLGETLFTPCPVEQPDACASLASAWQQQRAYIAERVRAAAARYGSAGGLDPDEPFNSLRFTLLSTQATGNGMGEATVAVDIVRFERVETTLFGIIPTASRQIVAVERAGLLKLVAAQPEPPAWLPAALRVPSTEWYLRGMEGFSG